MICDINISFASHSEVKFQSNLSDVHAYGPKTDRAQTWMVRQRDNYNLKVAQTVQQQHVSYEFI